MPTYEYECRQCGHHLEQFQNISAAPLKKCPSCGRSSLRRLLGAGAGIIFKGTGFYQTDYRRGSPVAVSGAADAAKSAAVKDASGKKPATAKAAEG